MCKDYRVSKDRNFFKPVRLSQLKNPICLKIRIGLKFKNSIRLKIERSRLYILLYPTLFQLEIYCRVL